MWQYLRLRGSSEAKEQPEVLAWSQARFEEIVDVDAIAVKWDTPPRLKNRFRMRNPTWALQPPGPFRKMTGEFVHFVLSSFWLDQRLPVACLQASAHDRGSFTAVFEFAESGDVYFAPKTIFGTANNRTTSIAWRVTRDEGCPANDSIPIYRCHGLALALWPGGEEEEEDMGVVSLR